MAKKVDMRVIKEILEIYEKNSNLSYRKIALMCGCSKNTVKSIIDRASSIGMEFRDLVAMNNEQLRTLFYPNSNPYSGVPEPNIDEIIEKLRKKHVTLKMLHEEYKANYPNGIGYTQFCERIRKTINERNLTLHFERKPGEKMEIDWSGDKVEFRENGEVKKAIIFVSTIGVSGYAFMKPFRDTKSESFNIGVISALEYFGGVPKIAVPDNDKSAVIKASKYHSELNRSFKNLAKYYNFAVIPARIRSPRDKPVVENTVLNVAERYVIGQSYNKIFDSFTELENFVATQLEKFNIKEFQKKEGTRKSVFEKVDKPELSPLPKTPYQIIKYKVATVGIDYHVQYNKKYYSVPYTYARKQVELQISRYSIDIYCDGEKIATHFLLDTSDKKYSTYKEHMPERHIKVLEGLSKEYFIQWAEKIDNNTKIYFERYLDRYKIKEQAFRPLRGLMNFCGQDEDSFKKTVDYCLQIRDYSYNLFKTVFESVKKNKTITDTAMSVTNTNIRGREYFTRRKNNVV